jgi:hypothetical protein
LKNLALPDALVWRVDGAKPWIRRFRQHSSNRERGQIFQKLRRNLDWCGLGVGGLLLELLPMKTRESINYFILHTWDVLCQKCEVEVGSLHQKTLH